MIIRQYLKPNVSAYLFCPREAMDQFRVEQRQRRKTKVQPSQVNRKRRHPKQLPGERYTVTSYTRAVKRGILMANTARACEKCRPLPPEKRCEHCQANAIPHWHPHQLRHTKATEIRREFGLDAARAALGHRSPQITEHYAEIDLGKAAAVAEKLG